MCVRGPILTLCLGALLVLQFVTATLELSLPTQTLFSQLLVMLGMSEQRSKGTFCQGTVGAVSKSEGKSSAHPLPSQKGAF